MCLVCEGKTEGRQELYCSGCPNITSIPVIEGLKYLHCYSCPLLTSIPVIPGLQYLYCYDCRLLTSIPVIEGLQKLYYNCPWLSTSQDFETKLRKVRNLQRFCRKNFPYFVFKRWIETREFAEWFYSPENLGGRVDRRRFLRTVNKIINKN